MKSFPELFWGFSELSSGECSFLKDLALNRALTLWIGQAALSTTPFL